MSVNCPLIPFLNKNKKDHSRNVFYNNSCILQEKNSGRTIGHAKKWNGLYYMEDSAINSHFLISKSTMTNKEKFQLHHYRLAHPAFQVIKFIFPFLFKNLKVKCLLVRCEFTKHKLVNFPTTNKRSPVPYIGSFLLKHKFEVSSTFIQSINMIKNQFGINSN